MVSLSCQQCGSTFQVDKDRQYTAKYCNLQCWGKAQEVEKVKLNCKVCNKEFSAYPSAFKKGRKYCSLECAYKDHDRVLNTIKSCTKGEYLICPQCGKKFFKPPSRKALTKSPLIYCSHKCFNDSCRVKRTCLYCGKVFNKRRSEIDDHRGLYCSNNCKLKALLPQLHTPEANLKASSTRRLNGTYSANAQYSRTHKGYRADLNNQYFRSSWEANYARYLNFLIKQKQITKWEYEPETFWFEKIRRGVRSYTPDFKVFNNNGASEFHEIKGWMDRKSKTKIKRMGIYHPNIKLIVIDEKQYRVLSKQLRGLIPNWEGKR